MRNDEIDSFFSYNNGHYVHYSAETEDGRGYEYRMVCSRSSRTGVTGMSGWVGRDRSWTSVSWMRWPE